MARILLSYIHTHRGKPHILAGHSLFTNHGQHQQVDAVHGVVVERHARVSLHVASDGRVLAVVGLLLDNGMVVVISHLGHCHGLRANAKQSPQSFHDQ